MKFKLVVILLVVDMLGMSDDGSSGANALFNKVVCLVWCVKALGKTPDAVSKLLASACLPLLPLLLRGGFGVGASVGVGSRDLLPKTIVALLD